MSPQPPGPGSWTLDATHCERAHSGYLSSRFAENYTQGMRESMARYGALLDTLECRLVDGFTYTSPRPLGAPPGARTPPAWLFWMLVRLVPPLRARTAVAAEVMRTRRWREDVHHFSTVLWPRWQQRLRALAQQEPTRLDDAALGEHLRECDAALWDGLGEHFQLSLATIVPVGDFAAHVVEWTGCTPGDVMALLRGHSPASLDALQTLDAVVSALRTRPDARAWLDAPPAEALERLRTDEGELGAAARTWLWEVGERVLSGHDVHEPRAIEVPGVMVRSLVQRLNAPATTSPQEDPVAALRTRVPAEHRATFDELLHEARLAHPLRDGRSTVDFWTMGLARRALLEAGQRLTTRGRLRAPEHTLDLRLDEVLQLLAGATSPDATEAERRYTTRSRATCSEMPELLGPPPEAPPPAELLPAPAARVARAMNLYIDLMFREADRRRDDNTVRGIAASPGRTVGQARLVLGPEDFSRIVAGDVLVARLTTPAYNCVLPLLSGIATERGGLLSHPAIVAREYGMPGVVGARGILELIRDGDRIEVDGDAGTVRVLR
ncbi:MAG: PEP-utilizing enzyme [Myxococcota bacterium]